VNLTLYRRAVQFVRMAPRDDVAPGDDENVIGTRAGKNSQSAAGACSHNRLTKPHHRRSRV
jgi:hypothetical protein